MVDELDGGVILVTQDDAVDLDEGPGGVLSDAPPNLVLVVEDQISTLVEEPLETLLHEQVAPVQLIELPSPDLVVELSEGPQGATGPEGPEGPQGPPGPSGGETFTFSQGTPSDTWTVNHALGRFPSVTVTDTAGTKVYGSVEYIDDNNVVLTFSAPFAGVAYFN